ncbi:hypothetical protein [Trichothermofontia sp.]
MEAPHRRFLRFFTYGATSGQAHQPTMVNPEYSVSKTQRGASGP